MKNPFTFRPKDAPEEAPGEPYPDDWADNWASNFMAWFALTFLPIWCSTKGHWTSRVTDALFTDCPCCLLWRGLTIGFLAGLLLGLLF